MKIKLLSYNIHKGFDWNNQRYILSEMKELITETGADIVFLQEVSGENLKNRKKGLVDEQLEFFADGIWPHYSYGKNSIYDHGHHGNLILSKFPIESFENVNLTTNIFEKRGMLICKIKTTESYFYAASLHLNLLHSGRELQYQKIEKYLRQKTSDLPTIIAGDFNDWNKKSSDYFEEKLGMQEIYKTSHGQYAKSFPSKIPFLCLDRVYVKKFMVLGSELVLPQKSHLLSDHLPLLGEVEFYEK
jgi:endonuclease/exonuclease/phosphatase family metal-dependent hydrolase